MAKSKTSKNEADDNTTPITTNDLDSLSDILQSGEFLVETSGGGKNVWYELTQKPQHVDMLINNINTYLNDRGYSDSFVKTIDNKSITFPTVRRDVKAQSINNLIEKVNEQYETVANNEGIPEEERETPIADRLHVGTKQLSSDVSAFNNAMIEMDIPHKWGVRKNTGYEVIKLQRIEGGK